MCFELLMGMTFRPDPMLCPDEDYYRELFGIVGGESIENMRLQTLTNNELWRMT